MSSKTWSHRRRHRVGTMIVGKKVPTCLTCLSPRPPTQFLGEPVEPRLDPLSPSRLRQVELRTARRRRLPGCADSVGRGVSRDVQVGRRKKVQKK